MSTELGLILAVMVVGFFWLGAMIWWINKSKSTSTDLEKMVNQIFGLSVGKITEQSKQILATEKEAIKENLEHKEKTIEKLVTELRSELKTRQDEIRSLEQDRVKKFGELSSQLETHRQLATELQISTRQLASVLSNNQQRGEWGERIIEDLLKANGLMEGVHYLRQAVMGEGRPDIVLLLPNKRNVPVDVKFPYSEIQKMSLATTKEAKLGHEKQFTRDLRQKVHKVAAYIHPELNTLDYAILFVPNEMVFSYINQKFPDVVDEAMRMRVIIVSPFTFLIVARTVIESYRNFMLEDKLKEVVHHITAFVQEWSKFKDQFSKYGRSIDTLQKDYEQIVGTRVKQMDRKIDQIQQDQAGELLTAVEKTSLIAGPEIK